MSLLSDLDDDFLLLNGDILTDLDFGALLNRHRACGATGTLAVYNKRVGLTLGVVELDAQDNVAGYVEKPAFNYLVSSGICCFRPDVIRHLERGAYCDLPELVLRLVRRGERVRGYRFEGYWLDIGRPEDYEVALEEFAKRHLR